VDTGGIGTALAPLPDARHPGARFEAEERGPGEVPAEEPGPEPGNLLLQAVTAADMTTSPVGEPVLPEHRIQEALNRYGPESPAHRAVARPAPRPWAAAAGPAA
jgi:hypothetical protein